MRIRPLVGARPSLFLAVIGGGRPGTRSPTWFDAATARELMDARREFDAAELEAIAAFEQRCRRRASSRGGSGPAVP